jgi:hydrogenase expression/formation protein HypC
MCLSVPAQVVAVDGDRATVNINGVVCPAGAHLVDNLRPGDWVLMHAGYILERITREDAQETLALLDEIEKAMQP